MMPPGRLMDLESTRDGMRTGLEFLELLKKSDETIPVIILTNAKKEDIRPLNHANCQIFEKKDMDPWVLVEILSEVKRKVSFYDD
jgi:DNA-binding NarL/FixJ family response regulator